MELGQNAQQKRDSHEMDFLDNAMKAINQFDLHTQNRLLKDFIGRVIDQRNNEISDLHEQLKAAQMAADEIAASIKDLPAVNN